eukprot:TRINITY_DN5065_c0_g1_i1.p1 TRINITY_DN5065_c0_g1~~TRINITY_DN5065_c0_g1_i1.p1  ORF type:complete len:307 (+),score=21.84 TRINITY_DN5065_c0_g1_i1:37-921(+)
MSNSKKHKIIHLIRHGQSEHNVRSVIDPITKEETVDPDIFDAPLSAKGQMQSKSVDTSTISPTPQVVIVSPLTRTLETCRNIFIDQKECKIAIEVNPICRELITTCTDHGRDPHVLAKAFPEFKFDHLSPVWWYCEDHCKADEDCHRMYLKSRKLEPFESLDARIDQFVQELIQRPEEVIAVVLHADFLRRFFVRYFGKDIYVANCEVRTIELPIDIKRIDDDRFQALLKQLYPHPKKYGPPSISALNKDFKGNEDKSSPHRVSWFTQSFWVLFFAVVLCIVFARFFTSNLPRF